MKKKFNLYKLAALSLASTYLLGGQFVYAESSLSDTLTMMEVSFEIDAPQAMTIETAVPLSIEFSPETSAETTTLPSTTESASSLSEQATNETTTIAPSNTEASGAVPSASTTNKPVPKPTPVSTTSPVKSTSNSTTANATESKNSTGATTIQAPTASPTNSTSETSEATELEPTPTPELSPTPTPTPVPVDDTLTGLSSVHIPLTDVYSRGPRLTAPTKENPYYFSSNPFARAGFPMPNCTAYVFGRAWEMLGTMPKLSTRDAHYFWGDNIREQVYAYGQEPKVGSIACWNSGEFGHVAIVEEIGPNMILISESFWNGAYFNTRWIPKQTPSLQGYIYLANFTNEVFSEQPENKDFVARILSEDGAKALAADGRSIVIQESKDVSSEQYWRISLGDDGFYEIRNANGFVLDVAGALNRDGVSIQLDDKTTSEGQGWNISILNKLVRFEPQYTDRKISVFNDTHVEIYSEESAAELKATQFFSLDRIEMPVLKVLPSLRTNVVNFKLDSKISGATEAYLKIYKESFGKGSAVIEPITPGESISIALDPGFYEVCVEIGAGHAISSSEIQSFSLAVSNSKTNKFLDR